MSISNTLTASSFIQSSIMSIPADVTQDNPLITNLSIYDKGVAEISKLGIEKQQKEIQVEASRGIADIASKMISIDSTIGRAVLLVI